MSGIILAVGGKNLHLLGGKKEFCKVEFDKILYLESYKGMIRINLKDNKEIVAKYPLILSCVITCNI